MADTPEASTRQRIKVAARRLFAERGVEAVTVREIVTAANARNIGSLNYYFGSKDELVMSLVEEILRENTEALMDGFGEIQRHGGARSVRDIVTLIVDSYRPVADPSPTAARFMASVMTTRRRNVQSFIRRMQFVVYGRLLRYVIELSPDIPPAVLRQRWILFAWCVISALSAHEVHLVSGRRSAIWDEVDPRRNLIDSATALLCAEWSGESEGG